MNTVLQKNIKQQLKKQNLSIAELERRIGLRHAVVNILHGRSKNPSIHLAHAIAKELGFSVESMLTESIESVGGVAIRASDLALHGNATPTGADQTIIATNGVDTDNTSVIIDAAANAIADATTIASAKVNMAVGKTTMLTGSTSAATGRATLWDADLGMATLAAVNDFINANAITPDINSVLLCVNEIYSYAIGGADKQIDYRFVQWICERNFLG